MRVRKVLVLKDVADDMNEGKAFYETKGSGLAT